jgi:hypothetical protein
MAKVLKEPSEQRISAGHPAKWIDQLSLSAGTAAAYTVPVNVDLIRITFTAGTLYMRADGSVAVVPVAGIVDGTGAEKVLDGDVFAVEPGDVISFINASACIVIFSCKKCFVTG